MVDDLNTLASGDDDSNLKSASVRRDSVLQQSSFAWAPLTDASKEIRVCRILPGFAGSQIQVVLRVVTLEEAVGRYNCLSYAWKTKRTTDSILLNNCYHLIPNNLHLQLSRLRALGLTQDLWCDFLCIAQDDATERSIHVAMMGAIFSNAGQVFLAVDEGGQLLKPSAIQQSLQKLSCGSHLRHLDCFGCKDAERASVSFPNSVAAQQLRRILTASFWTRAWTVQEIVLARKAFMIGEWGTIPFSALVDASEAYNKHRKVCCASFVSALPKDVRLGCYQVCNQSVADSNDDPRK